MRARCVNQREEHVLCGKQDNVEIWRQTLIQIACAFLCIAVSCLGLKFLL